MKVPALILAAVAVAGGLLAILLFVNPFGDEEAVALEPAVLESMDADRQESALTRFLIQEAVPEEDRIRIVKWAFLNRPAFIESFIRDNAIQLVDMPGCLSEVALELLREGDRETAVACLLLARDLYPNDPEVLGALGISSFLAGRMEDARQYLEQAESWRHETPWVDFYLGALLVRSEASADRARGKTLLMRAVERRDRDLSELAGLTLLADETIPLLESDYRKIFAILKELGSFHSDNPNLTADVMRILTNRSLRYAPELALEMATLLFEFPEVTDADRLVMAGMAQSLGETETAGRILNELGEKAFPEGSPGAADFKRLKAVQDLVEGRFDEGMEAFRSLVESASGNPQMHEAFHIVLKDADLPLDTEREFLKLYLELDVERIQLSLAVLSKLVEVTPLKQDQWADYAVRVLLPDYPSMTANWLARNGQSKRIIAALEGKKPDLSEEERIALAEAHIAEDQPAEARSVLEERKEHISAGAREFLLARVCLMEGDREAAMERWKAATNAALSSSAFPLMKNLGFLALELDQPVNALQSLYTAFNAGISFSQAQLGRLLNLTLTQGTLTQTIRVAEALRAAFPEEPVYINNLAYFKFLAKEDLESHVETMRGLAEDYPDITQYRLTLALGLLRIGRTNEAQRLLDSTAIDWEKAGTRGQMIYAAVLAAGNQRVLAEGLIQNIELDDLIPEEQALLETD